MDRLVGGPELDVIHSGDQALQSDRSGLVFSLNRANNLADRANLISVVGELMGLILAIIGTGMVTEGIKLTFNL